VTSPTAQQSGLARWRERQAEEKARRMAELACYREDATVEERDGREFRVVRIPDSYGERGNVLEALRGDAA
jgi:hypothetical protein